MKKCFIDVYIGMKNLSFVWSCYLLILNNLLFGIDIFRYEF